MATISFRWIAQSFLNVNADKYSNFNATTLNASAAAINETMTTNVVQNPGYLFATLTAENATVPGVNSSQSGQGGSSGGSSGGSNNTDLAM